MSEREKGLGLGPGALDDAEIAALGWNLLREDLSLPTAVLRLDRLTHNRDWMQRFMNEYGVQFAPHGKTTMAPKLFAMQMEGGAWGITLATAQQVQAAYRHGVRRILMANQLVGRTNMAIVSELLADPAFDFYCLVDSAALVEHLAALFRERGQRLQVLLELGERGGRTGVRDEEQMREVLEALERHGDALALCGVEIYEGVLKEESQIRSFLQRAASTTQRLLADGRFARSPALLSGAGSSWYDVVAEVFTHAAMGDAVEIVLRPGCYLTHDAGDYRAAQERILETNPIARRMRAALVPALQIWAYVQSIPEAELAIVGMGKRDASFDPGLPMPALTYRPGAAGPHAVPAHWRVTRMMDQHTFLSIHEGDDVRVGDMVAFDIAHPCLTFDKWRALPVVDAEYRVVDVVRTCF